MIMLTLLLAFCSYRWVEQPCRKATVPQRQVFAMVGGGMAFMLMIAMVGVVGKGFPSRLDDVQQGRLRLIADAQREVMFDNGHCIFNDENVTEVFKKRFLQCAQQYQKAVLIIGDSHGRDMYNALATNTNRPFVVGVTHHGCRPQIEKPACQYKQVSEFVELNASYIEAVFYDQAGQHFLRHETMLPFKKDEIAKAQDYLLNLALFTRVFWIGPQAEPDVDLQNMNILFRAVTAKDATSENKLIYAVDEFLEKSNRDKSIEYISTLRILQYEFERDFFIEGQYTYADKHHWSSAGERYFGKRLLINPTLSSIMLSGSKPVLIH
jgi:hypothetical protein